MTIWQQLPALDEVHETLCLLKKRLFMFTKKEKKLVHADQPLY